MRKKLTAALLVVFACAVGSTLGLAACKTVEHTHNWGNWTVTDVPTETDSGKAARSCTADGCNAETEDKEYILPALTSSDYTATADTATCTSAGKVTYTYDKDGVSLSFDVQTPVNAEAHKYGGWIAEVHAACEVAGTKGHYHCSLCGKDFDGEYAEISDLTIAAPGHDYAEEFTVDKEATCTEEGSKSKHCSRCDATTEVTVIEKLAHNAGEWIEDAGATCSAEGSRHKLCTVCGATVETESITKLAHTVVEDAAVAATCTEEGKTAGSHCSVCNEIIVAQQVVPALGHDYAEEFTVDEEATCTAEGSKSKHCSRCDATTEVTVIEKLAHTVVEDAAVAATCTEEGKTAGSHCSVCNEIIVAQEIIPALGHDLVHHDAKAATCTEAGWNAYDTCSRCDYTTYEEIAILAHNYQWSITTAPTATVSGYVEKVCSVCGAADPATAKQTIGVLVDASVTNGTYTKTTVTAATCEQGGTEVYVLTDKVADGELAGKEVGTVHTAALGHSYELTESGSSVISECSVCGKSDGYAFDEKLTVSSTADVKTVEDKVYFVNSTVTSNWYSFTVSEAKKYEFTFVLFSAAEPYARLYSLKLGSTTIVSTRGLAATYSSFVSITNTWGTSVLGENFACGNQYSKYNIIKFSLDFTEEYETYKEQAVQFNIATTGTATSPAYYLMGSNVPITALTGEEIDAEKYVFKVGDNTVVPEDTYATLDTTVDRYTFTVPKDGWYEISSPEGVNFVMVQVTEDGNSTDVLDTAEARSVKFEAAAGTSYTYAFIGIDSKTAFTVTIAETEPDAAATLDPANELTVKLGGKATETVTISEGVEEGDYEIGLNGGALGGRMIIYITVNGDTEVKYQYQAGVAANKSGYLTQTIHLKAGDVLELANAGTTSLQLLVKMTAAEEEVVYTLGLGDAGSVTASFTTSSYDIYPELAEEVTSGTYNVTVTVVEGTLDDGAAVVVSTPGGRGDITISGGTGTCSVTIDLSSADQFYIRCVNDVTLKIVFEAAE